MGIINFKEGVGIGDWGWGLGCGDWGKVFRDPGIELIHRVDIFFFTFQHAGSSFRFPFLVNTKKAA